MMKMRRNLKLPPINSNRPPPTSACISRSLYNDDDGRDNDDGYTDKDDEEEDYNDKK